MRILMLGNSFTYYNDMPLMLAALLQAEVVAHTRGGAFLYEHLDPAEELGQKTLEALKNEKWDYVIMQEQSKAPIFAKECFHKSVQDLCQLICQAGAKPVLYATWTYRDGSEKLLSTQLTYDQMYQGLHESYAESARENDILMADVGTAFKTLNKTMELYMEDDFHPSQSGSMLAAAMLAQTIIKDQK